LFQTQLSGEHLLGWLLDSRLEWRGTWSRAIRDEPDNRQAQYVMTPGLGTGEFSLAVTVPNTDWVRFLNDVSISGQVDWATPFSLRDPQDGQLKFGGLARRKNRDFEAQQYTIYPLITAPNAAEIFKLPPEQAFAPENLGTTFRFERTGLLAQSYAADDDVTAGYGMLDLPLLRGVRLVGGARFEDWRMSVFPGGRDSTDAEVRRRVNKDWLWSANLVWRLGDRTNVRLAGYRTVARPDAREISPDSYVAVTGDCDFRGNADLQRTSILNGDFRFEVYPGSGEIVAVSGFYKRFHQPIIEFITTATGGQCAVLFGNGEHATNYGAELEVRKRLGRFFAGGNLTLIRSRVAIDTALGSYDPNLPLQGQSPLLVNGSVGYFDPAARLEVTVLANYFADRIARYGTAFNRVQGPNTTERGRWTLDAKATLALGSGLGVSMSGRNLTNQPIMLVNEGPETTAVVGQYRSGVGLTLGLSYDF
jgi:hypothetical protein